MEPNESERAQQSTQVKQIVLRNDTPVDVCPCPYVPTLLRYIRRTLALKLLQYSCATSPNTNAQFAIIDIVVVPANPAIHFTDPIGYLKPGSFMGNTLVIPAQSEYALDVRCAPLANCNALSVKAQLTVLVGAETAVHSCLTHTVHRPRDKKVEWCSC